MIYCFYAYAMTDNQTNPFSDQIIIIKFMQVFKWITSLFKLWLINNKVIENIVNIFNFSFHLSKSLFFYRFLSVETSVLNPYISIFHYTAIVEDFFEIQNIL